MRQYVRFAIALGAVAVVCLGSGIVAVMGAARQGPPEIGAVDAARRAVVGRGTVTRVTSLILMGKQTENGRPKGYRPQVRVELRVLLPDHYLRIENNDSIITRYGVSEGTAIRDWKGLAPGVMQRIGGPSPAVFEAERLIFARLALGLLAETRTLVTLRPASNPARDAGGGLLLVGDKGLQMALDLDQTSGLPTRVRYEDEVPITHQTSQGTKNGAREYHAKIERYHGEVTLAFNDRRSVDGVLVPHRITLSARGVVLDELVFDRVRVNPPLTAKDFERPAGFRE